MGEALQGLSNPALNDAIEGNFWESMKLFRRRPLVELYAGPDIHWFITDIPVSPFNVVGRANLAPDAVDSEIEAAIGRGRSRNVPVSWRIGPGTRPTDLDAYLERHGFTFARDEPGMAADLLALNESLPKPTGLVSKPVVDDETLEQFCHTAVVGFEMPGSIEGAFKELWASVGLGAELPLRHYLGWLDGKPVATLSLFLGAGVAGIYAVATAPEARRKGIGTEMTLAACRDACALGYRVAVLGASKMGFGVYQKIGFRKVCEVSYFVWKPDTVQGE